jgi:hypothetical protein
VFDWLSGFQDDRLGSMLRLLRCWHGISAGPEGMCARRPRFDRANTRYEVGTCYAKRRLMKKKHLVVP